MNADNALIIVFNVPLYDLRVEDGDDAEDGDQQRDVAEGLPERASVAGLAKGTELALVRTVIPPNDSRAKCR